jgi:acyl-CoA synthetase (NDP forming)
MIIERMIYSDSVKIINDLKMLGIESNIVPGGVSVWGNDIEKAKKIAERYGARVIGSNRSSSANYIIGNMSKRDGC